MKLSVLSVSLCIFLSCLFLTSSAQDNKPYKDGPLWQVQFIKTKPGMGEVYLKNLSEGWVKVMSKAKEQSLIMDYKVLACEPSSKDDWDLMLLYELKNYAALDGLDDKMAAIRNGMIGSEDVQHQAAISRNDLRELHGGKLTQELIF